MKIPKRFKLFNTTIDVYVGEHEELMSLTDRWGMADLPKQRILIATDAPDPERVLWHEIVHYLLNYLGYDKENEDEQFVDLLARSLDQVINSFEYAEETSLAEVLRPDRWGPDK